MSLKTEKFWLTPEGGYAILLTNKTGANSVKGTLVKCGTGTDNSFIVSPTNEQQTIGAVYESGIADGSECWVVIGGIAECLLEDSTAATRSYWCGVSGTTAGRMQTAAAPPNTTQHWEELGHTLESKAGGTDVLCKIAMHFN